VYGSASITALLMKSERQEMSETMLVSPNFHMTMCKDVKTNWWMTSVSKEFCIVNSVDRGGDEIGSKEDI
jgi:hypothetical protein